MLIRITDIPLHGLKLNDTIDLNSLNSRLQEGRPSDIRFTSVPEVKLFIQRTPNGAQVEGSVKARVMQACSRCSSDLEHELEVETNYTLQQLTPRTSTETDETSDDIGLIYFEGEHVELEPTLQESLILGLSLFWHPPTQGDGSCVQCGLAPQEKVIAEKESKIKLSDLFKKVGLN